MHDYFLHNLGTAFIGFQKTGPRCPEWEGAGGEGVGNPHDRL